MAEAIRRGDVPLVLARAAVGDAAGVWRTTDLQIHVTVDERERRRAI
jgi:hypothetical protein